MWKWKRNAMLALGLAALAPWVQAQSGGSVTLKAGDKAPKLEVARWMKGQKTESFQPGKVYVVEFWATWCGPCIAAFPHLTELAKKYQGKVNFTGVNVWETNNPQDASYLDKVEKFVKDQGDRMGYNVAADTPQGAMAKTWLEAAGQNGIPCAFIVNQEGKIAWIGHPMDHMDQVLDQVLAGTFDIEKHAAIQAAAQTKQAELEKILAPLVAAIEASDYPKAWELYETAVKDAPELEEALWAVKIQILLHTNPAEAARVTRLMFEVHLRDDANGLNTIAYMIVGDDEIKSADYDLALQMAQRAVSLTQEKNAYILDTLAFAYFRKNDKAKAVSVQEKAIALAEADGEFPAEVLEEMKQNLKRFKS